MESYLKQLTKCVIAFVYLSLFYSYPTPFNILFIFCVFVHVPVYDDYVCVPSSYLLEWAPLALTTVKHKNVKNSTEDKKIFSNVGMFVFGNAACQMTFFFSLLSLFSFLIKSLQLASYLIGGAGKILPRKCSFVFTVQGTSWQRCVSENEADGVLWPTDWIFTQHNSCRSTWDASPLGYSAMGQAGNATRFKVESWMCQNFRICLEKWLARGIVMQLLIGTC